MMIRFIPLFVFFLLTVMAQAKPITGIIIEGVPTSQTDFYRNKILPLLKTKEALSDIQNAIEVLYKTDTLSYIDVFTEEVSDDKTNLIFKLTLRQSIKKIKFNGNGTYSNSDLFSELGINEGDGYSEDKIKLGIENVKKFYNLSGFLNAQVGAHFAQANAGELTLIVDIEEGSPCRIENIQINSANIKLNKELLERTKKKIRKNFSQNTLNDIQSNITEHLIKEKFYSSTISANEPSYNSTKTGVTLNFTVSDPYSYALVFEGNEKFTPFQIINDLKLEENNRLSSSPVDDLTERVLKFYKKRGYANVVIKHKENIYLEDYVRRINFTITEGSKIKIKAINIEGSYSRKPDYYSDFIYSHSGELIDSKYYNSDDLDVGVKNLVTDLQNQGFITAQIPTTRVDYDKRRETVTIKIVLNEGPQTYIDKIIFKGSEHIKPKELEQVIGLKSGGPLHLSELADASLKITELYKSKGYLDVKVTNQAKDIIAYTDDNKRANLTFDIYEGPLVIVSSVVVEGNNFTKDYVIKRELQFQNDDILTPDKISYSEQRLQSLGLFGTIEIRTLSDDPKEGRRTVLIYVTERNPGILKGGIGADNELTLSLKGYVGAAYKNLFGTGRSISGRLQVNDKVKYGFFEKELNFGYTEPFLFGTENNIKLSGVQSSKLYYINKDSTVVPQGEKVFAIDTTQYNVILERDITRNLKLLLELYGFAHTNTYEIFAHADPIPIDIGTTGPTLIYDLRDNIFNPSRGFLGSLSLEYASPSLNSSSTVNYVKGVTSMTKYFPLGPLVFAQEAKVGYTSNLSHESDGAIPQVKSFVLGGRSTIRGFEPEESVPKLLDIPYGIKSSYNLFYLAKSELRFPISGAFGGVLFYDGGHVEFTGYNQQFPWRDSAGLGLRYNTPVGPVSLEYGFKLNRDETRGESPAALHFSIGVF